MKKLSTIAFAFALAFSFFFVPEVVQAQVDGGNLQAQMITDTDQIPLVQSNTQAFGGSLRQAITTFLNYALGFLGIIATAFIIFAGFLYVTSGGDDGQAEKAKKIMLYAAIGIIVILISYALVNTLLVSGQGPRAV